MKKSVALCCTVALLSGCAGAGYRPLIDSRGVDSVRYESDLRDCQAYSAQVQGAAQSAAAGAVVGAIFGVALAAVVGHGVSRDTMAGVGALDGAVTYGAQGEANQRAVILRCLAGRGYSVLM